MHLRCQYNITERKLPWVSSLLCFQKFKSRYCNDPGWEQVSECCHTDPQARTDKRFPAVPPCLSTCVRDGFLCADVPRMPQHRQTFLWIEHHCPGNRRTFHIPYHQISRDWLLNVPRFRTTLEKVMVYTKINYSGDGISSFFKELSVLKSKSP